MDGGPSPGFEPHPAAPAGTRLTAGSFPLFSDFKLGRFAGGRRAVGTLPKLCMPFLVRSCVPFCCVGSFSVAYTRIQALYLFQFTLL